MPTAWVAAGNASLTSSANGKTGFGWSGASVWQQLGQNSVQSKCSHSSFSSAFSTQSVRRIKLLLSRFLCLSPAAAPPCDHMTADRAEEF